MEHLPHHLMPPVPRDNRVSMVKNNNMRPFVILYHDAENKTVYQLATEYPEKQDHQRVGHICLQKWDSAAVIDAGREYFDVRTIENNLQLDRLAVFPMSATIVLNKIQAPIYFQ